jgi:hypothetical protein
MSELTIDMSTSFTHCEPTSKPRAIIDRHSYIIGVVVGGPKGEEAWWASTIRSAFKEVERLRRYGDFTDRYGGDARFRLGITYGEEVRVSFSPAALQNSKRSLFRAQAPHGIGNLAANLAEAHNIETSEALNAICGYQNRKCHTTIKDAYVT